jgi:hypothetical protein
VSWRLTLHERSFATSPAFARDTAITELSDCRSRRLEQKLNTPATLSFTIDGRSQAALYIQELTTEIMAWRTNENGVEALMFRGVVTQSQDSVSEQAHTLNITAHDHLALIVRRYLAGRTYTQEDQDDIVDALVKEAIYLPTMQPGSIVQLVAREVNSDGTARTVPSGVLRDREYANGASCGGAITDLTAVIGGPDVDVAPDAAVSGIDWLRVFPPKTAGGGGQGVNRPDTPLVYGISVSSFSRSVNSTQYTNFVRVIGAAPDGSPTGTPPLFAEASNADANDVGRVPVGTWMSVENASDVKEAATLAEKAAGVIRDQGVLVPSYSLNLRPGWYRPGYPNMGDTVPLTLAVGRLDVSGTVRVLGIDYAIGDDGQEDVTLTVGRPALTLTSLFSESRRDINALARR